jgi:hypothetical protein
MLNYAEKRRNPRFMIPGALGKYNKRQVRGAIKDFSMEFPLLNISEGGAAFESIEKLESNQEVVFQLLAPEDPPLNLFSQVRRQDFSDHYNDINTTAIEFMPFGNGQGVNTSEKLETLKRLNTQFGYILQPKITISPEWGIVYCIASGNLNNTYMLEIVKRSSWIAEKHKFNKMLFDFSDMKISESFIGIYNYPALAKSVGIPTYLKMAILYSNENDKFGFLETVCRNSGYYNIHIFDNNDSAIEWLLDN